MTVRAETAMASALSRAGFNAAESRLRQLAMDVLTKHHGNFERAKPTFIRSVDNDPELINEALGFYLQSHSLLRGDQICVDTREGDVSSRQSSDGDEGQSRADAHHVRAFSPSSSRGHKDHSCDASQSPAVQHAREPSPGQRSAAASVAKQAALTVFDIHKTADGRRWGDVGAHELDGMDRDGAVARAIKLKLGTLSNEQRFKNLRDLISPANFAAIWAQTREAANA